MISISRNKKVPQVVIGTERFTSFAVSAAFENIFAKATSLRIDEVVYAPVAPINFMEACVVEPMSWRSPRTSTRLLAPYVSVYTPITMPKGSAMARGRLTMSVTTILSALLKGMPAAACVTDLSTAITTGTTDNAETTELRENTATSACHGILAKASGERLGAGPLSPPIFDL